MNRCDFDRRNYLVQFFYETDLRAKASVWAYNEMIALALALEEIGQDKWVDERGGFKIVIKLEN